MVLLSFLTHLAVGANLLAQVPLVNSLALYQDRATVSLDDFIASESPIALQGILNNIGSAGSNAVGVALGLVVASPAKENPDCTYPLLSPLWPIFLSQVTNNKHRFLYLDERFCSNFQGISRCFYRRQHKSTEYN